MKKKILSTFLSLTLAVSAFPAAIGFAAETQPSAKEASGSIKATLRFDYPQLLSKVQEKNINVTVYNENKEAIGKIPFDGDITGEISGKTGISKKNVDGTELTNEKEIGYFDMDISGLPLGEYSFAFEGDGYTSYKTPAVKLEDYSQQIILGTGDKTFSIGDVNKDNKVDNTDRGLMSKALGKTDEESLAVYDLNGDDKIDIIDLVYVNHQINPVGDVQVFDTALIAHNAVKTEDIANSVNVSGGAAEDMFNENNETPVTLSTKTSGDGLVIPIEFNKAAEMEQIEVISPEGAGSLTAGVATVTYEDGTTEEIPFDYSVPEGVHLLSEREGTTSVVISLGKRVAVKKIVINVTKVEGEDDKPQYTVVQEIKFLKDIVPENPAPQVLSVKNVKTQPLSESVKLTWNEFPNVSGYVVNYGESSDNLSNEMTVDVNSALVNGLKNLKTYYFTVTPISEGWKGGCSEVVSAMPMPNKAPLKPDMVTVSAMDSALKVSWKNTENATYYKVFYKEADADKFVQYGDKTDLTSVSVGGLTNGTEYLLYVIAGNDIGESPRSDLATGTPEKEVIEAPKIPTLHMMDSSNIESIQMANSNNVNKAEYPNGFNVNNVADGDYSTHWTARAWWESNQFTFTFKEAKEMNYMVYVPRLDGNYRRSLENYSITVWDEDGNQKTVSKRISINSNTTGYMILPFEKTKVKKLAVSVAQWAGSPTGVSLAEAVFYESDNLESEVRELFADDIYTELSVAAMADKAATSEKIQSLREQANDANGYYVDKNVLLDELELAEKLLNGNMDALGTVKTDVQSRSTANDSSKYGQAGSDLQPLGVVAYSTAYAEKQKFADTKLTVYAHIPEGETAYLVPTQYYAEANSWQGGAIALQNGRNIIEVPQMGSQTSERGGSLYIKYSGANPDEVKLHIRQGAVAIPVLELGDWYDISESERRERIASYVENIETHVSELKNQNIDLRIANSTEISMPNVLLSVPADRVLSGIKPTGADNAAAAETLYNNVLAWEEVMHIVNTTQGIDDTLENSGMQSRQNIRYMRMFANAFMYAAGSHIGIGYGSVSGMVCGRPTSMMPDGANSNNLFGWGIAHEIGHNMDKLGKAEITNNIYSLMVQTYDGEQNTLSSRLEKSGKYNKIYEKVSAGRPGMSNDVFVQLGMYWQLHLAYDNGSEPLGFYNKLFKEWKSANTTGKSGDERFALIASKIADRDLTEFFESWGMRLSDSTKQTLASYPKETRKLQYLCDDSRRYRLSGGAEGTGTTTANAAIDSENEKQVNLTFSNTADSNSILGYEISRNGIVIAFTTESSYTDIIGSANNKAFSYSVQAIDMLGNKIGEAADAGQIRISYVKTVDKDSYILSRDEDGSLRAVMNETTAVSGVKITNAPASGGFSVSVKRTEDGSEKITSAKEGSFENNETPNAEYYVAYFNKPGADSSDTRIWTYDADEIVLTGIPESADVEFISYAGDNIEFTSNAAVGRLNADYKYGELEDEVIPAGTLIVTGEYRGDPLYNTVQINGRFVTVDSETGEQSVTERAIDGYSLLFAEVPEDGEVSDISDGIFVFVPNVQKEAELQGDVSDCSAESLLPAQIKAELYRTDTIESADSKRLTSDTVWIDSPSDESMPEIILE